MEYRKPTLHILPHWNWEGREGNNTVFVYTSYTSAELINGKSMGVQSKNKKHSTVTLMWMDVKYEPGTVKVVAYDTNGKVAEEKEIKRQVNHTRLFWMQTENHHSRWRIFRL
jgi:beta-galactosidase